jgi:hypothetical protein
VQTAPGTGTSPRRGVQVGVQHEEQADESAGRRALLPTASRTAKIATWASDA